ncbi:MAG: PAS domain S-box protein [Leptolyngbyaceae cyanobacterium RU_5_1]|nr:PAS domain S-box protein [Leptolyngbyaceae cyanobacterium RU_5_1]
MKLIQSTSRYWLTVGAIAIACVLSAIGSGLAIWSVVQQIDPGIVQGSSKIRPMIVLVQAISSIVVIIVAALTVTVAMAKQQQSEERSRSVFEGAAIGIGLDGLDGTILECNPALQTMLGYTREELAKMTFAEFTYPDDLAADVELFNEMILGTRDSYQIEKRHIRKNGQFQWVRLTNSLVRDGQGDPQYTIAMVEDITPLKDAQASIQLYGDIVKRMQVGLLVWHLQDLNDLKSFKLIECNPAALQILRVSTTPEKLLGKPMAEVFPDLVETAFPKLYADVIRSSTVRDLGEVRYGDSIIPEGVFATKAFPLPNQCVGLIFENITERKQAEEALQHSEARFRVVAETAACAFMVYQGNHLRYVNPAATEITGYSQDELMAIPFWELAHPEFQEIVRERGLARQKGEIVPRRYEVKILTKYGEERWVDITGGSASLNGQPAALATAYDITDRKHAEAQLRLAADRERLLSEIALRIRSSLNLDEILNTTVAEVRQFLQADRVFVSQFESNGCCRTVAESVDSKWPPVLGWETEHPTVEEIRQLFESDSVRVVNDIEEQIQKTPFLKEYQQRCQTKAGMGVLIMLNGEMFGVLVVNQCSSTRNWQSFEVNLLQQLGTQVEIAIQQGQLYQQVRSLAANLECQVEERTLELQHRMQELQSLNQVKDILLHAVSHDLRTPVQGMLMLLNKLRGTCNDTVTIPRPMLECMIGSCDRQLSLLNSLSENNAGTQANLNSTREPIYLNRVVENALAVLELQLAQNQTTVVNQISSDLPAVSADPVQLQQVFENLLSNAVKHNPPDRTITLTATVVDTLPGGPKIAEIDEIRNPKSEIRNYLSSLTPHASPKWLYCTVEDDGNGMTEEQCDRLFQLYVKGLDNRHLTGIGLGLYHCQRIISAHNGKIGINSRPDKGSRFWFALPLD